MDKLRRQMSDTNADEERRVARLHKKIGAMLEKEASGDVVQIVLANLAINYCKCQHNPFLAANEFSAIIIVGLDKAQLPLPPGLREQAAMALEKIWSLQ
jgi:hypothetical protein